MSSVNFKEFQKKLKKLEFPNMLKEAEQKRKEEFKEFQINKNESIKKVKNKEENKNKKIHKSK